MRTVARRSDIYHGRCPYHVNTSINKE